MSEKQKHIWRADITGLRALAVIPVVLYHAFPNVLSGGFVGVDVFFVISGYLISGILFRELRGEGRIRFADFYSKRVIRIFPNLIVLLLFSCILGYLFLFPDELSNLARQVYSSAIFVQNFRLLNFLGDYFSPSAETQPLLHLWSLSIEEQFYLIFPLICILAWKKCRNREKGLGILVFAITVGSLSFCVLTKDKTFAFYFPLTRFWELGFGICLAYTEIFSKKPALAGKPADLISVCGLLFIVVPIFGFSKETVFPGFMSVFPVFGALLLIMVGAKALVNNYLLSSRPFVFIGLISYSLYLWHWPIIVFGKIINPQLSEGIVCLLLAVSFVISVLVYEFIETPTRLIKGDARKRALFAVVLCMAIVFSLGEGIRMLHGFPGRSVVNSDAVSYKDDWNYPGNLMKLSVDGLNYYGNSLEFPEVFILGDSHAEQYASRFIKNAEVTNTSIAFVTAQGCPLVDKLGSQGGKIDNLDGFIVCKGFFDKAIKVLSSDHRVKKVVFGNIWGRYLTRGKRGWCVATAEKCIPLQQGGYKVGLNRLVDKLIESDKKVYFLLDVPWDEGSYDPISRVPRWNSLDSKQALSQIPFPYDESWEKGNQFIKTEFSNNDKIVIIDPVGVFCPNNLCDLWKYKDANHLRSSWVRDNAVWIDQIFKE